MKLLPEATQTKLAYAWKKSPFVFNRWWLVAQITAICWTANALLKRDADRMLAGGFFLLVSAVFMAILWLYRFSRSWDEWKYFGEASVRLSVSIEELKQTYSHMPARYKGPFLDKLPTLTIDELRTLQQACRDYSWRLKDLNEARSRALQRVLAGTPRIKQRIP